MNTSQFTSQFDKETGKSFDSILERLVIAVGGREVDVAKTLGISQQAISGAKAKQKIG